VKKIKISFHNDGIDHINVYSKGKTHLGRLLSNFAYTPIKTEDGDFVSIEGYWYWLLCDHPQRDELRKKFGNDAKALGRQLGATDWPLDDVEFERKILEAIRVKVYSNQEIKSLLIKTDLPFVHYYVYSNKVKMVSGCDWFLSEFDRIRKELQLV
jgi:predicted NAD-dependent protein-ADP-ribosyltransferase YbiA (DUF1768 family)